MFNGKNYLFQIKLLFIMQNNFVFFYIEHFALNKILQEADSVQNSQQDKNKNEQIKILGD